MNQTLVSQPLMNLQAKMVAIVREAAAVVPKETTNVELTSKVGPELSNSKSFSTSLT